MKRTILATLLLACTLSTQAQDINLPKPQQQKEKAMSVTKALATRHSVREYSDKELTLQQISNLCWAAFGVSRNDNFRTAPTAMNRKEIRLYVFTKQGAYEYDALANTLVEKAKGDHRSLVAGGPQFRQDFVLQAPVSLVMVIDYNMFSQGKHDERSTMMCCVDAGNVSENVNLYCQAVGLATVPRATMDSEGIKALLHLDDTYLPIMNNPVGYAK